MFFHLIPLEELKRRSVRREIPDLRSSRNLRAKRAAAVVEGGRGRGN